MAQAVEGKTFAITGKVTHFKNRGEIADYIKRFGGAIHTTVKKTTDFLVTNDTTSGSSKNRKAVEYGTKIITENELIELCGDEAEE